MSPTNHPSPTTGERKIQGRHLERLAVVYVRQSSTQQVQRHQESTQLQYGLVNLAERLGWRKERILVIDDDLGLSGASAEGRLGFQRLLSEVALDHVGIILGVEMSRLARSCKDWYQLLELCALFGTLIGDLDGLYDPTGHNDRLLLGLKGTMSEAELHILRQRLLQGALHKARRGELITQVPIGYVRDAAGQVSLDPDQQVQSVVRLIFEQFERLGSAAQVLRFLVRQGIQVPVRRGGRHGAGPLAWRRPNYTTVLNLLTHPMYAGAYVYGRTCQNPQARRQRQVPKRVPAHAWQVLLRDRHPAYLSWEQYERNLAQLTENRSRRQARGAIRRGRALLAGLVMCGRCGARLQTHYGGKRSAPRYLCEAARVVYGSALCQTLAAAPLDEEVVRLALQALNPAALEVSLQVAADVQQQRDGAEAQWQQRLERARYEAERARRQYDAVEPENRLVARTLEACWEEKLLSQRQLTEHYERFCQEQPRELSAAEQAQIRQLATDLPALWQSPSTTDADRKEILRQVVDKVVVQLEGNSEWVEVMIHWQGGQRSYTRFRRPVAYFDQLSTWPAIRARVQELKEAGHTATQIAAALNEAGWRTPEGGSFTAGTVRTLSSRYGLSRAGRRAQDLSQVRGPDEHWIPDLVRLLNVSYSTLYGWIRHGWVEARQLEGPHGRWVIRADDQKLAELRARAAGEPPTQGEAKL
jgi:DNA invertase Pin-like site-specific DNA recombinase